MLWDVGGVSGAELLGSRFTVEFTDGTSTVGELQVERGPDLGLQGRILDRNDGFDATGATITTQVSVNSIAAIFSQLDGRVFLERLGM